MAMSLTVTRPCPRACSNICKDNPTAPALPNHFYGSVGLDPERAGRDTGHIAEKVLAHLVEIEGANLTVTLEIQAMIPSRVTDGKVRIVTENCRVLKFTNQEFESE